MLIIRRDSTRMHWFHRSPGVCRAPFWGEGVVVKATVRREQMPDHLTEFGRLWHTTPGGC
ncbi:MAG: hypothetical protein ACYTGQ_06815 [Planctomycetota bacterium]